VHRAHDRQVGEERLAPRGEVAIADLSLALDLVALIAELEHPVALEAGVLQALDQVVRGDDRVEHIIPLPSPLEVPVDQEARLLARGHVRGHAEGAGLVGNAEPLEEPEEVERREAGKTGGGLAEETATVEAPGSAPAVSRAHGGAPALTRPSATLS